MSSYTKAQLEEFFYKQYNYIELLNDRIQLLQEQNEIYRAVNKKLTAEKINSCKEVKSENKKTKK